MHNRTMLLIISNKNRLIENGFLSELKVYDIFFLHTFYSKFYCSARKYFIILMTKRVLGKIKHVTMANPFKKSHN